MVYWDGIFNYSAINNFGAAHAKGDYLLLLNNDTEIISPDCLEQLLGYCMRPDVGAVGARLYYEDDTVQHAGVVVGFGGIAGHCFVQQKRDATGYCHRIICAQDYSAVTAACMMVKREAFDKVHGLSEEFQVAFNDTASVWEKPDIWLYTILMRSFITMNPNPEVLRIHRRRWQDLTARSLPLRSTGRRSSVTEILTIIRILHWRARIFL